MSSRKTKIVKELKIGDVEGVSQSKIEGYLSMGYKPYLNEKGKIKWLTEAQYSLRKLAEERTDKTLWGFKLPRRRKSRRRQLKSNFFLDNWLIILIVSLILLALLILYKYPHIIF
ncbi:MAG TPA: hypothetical protein GXX77_05670 [Candidatus Cloacimonetes bacterium]|nr:hypothetical protein [Candidatus Cloacimonadota bacterium]